MLITQEFVMRRFVSRVLRVVAVLAVSASVAQAQTETLMYDHVHMSVPDPQASAQWFHDHIGGEWVDGRTDRLLFGTTRIMWLGSRGEDRRPSAGGVIDHLGFSFANLSAKLAEVEGAGATVTTPRREVEGLFPLSFIVDPWGVRLELIEDPQHLGFHHVHLRDPEPAEALEWYHEQFGGVRRTVKGSQLEGILYPGNVWLLVSRGETFPSQGAAIDHIGWRAIVLDEKIAEFSAKGLELTTERRDMTLPNGQIAFFYIAGPNGARIEFVERARDMP
jgi:catechol 2,3-dioxygenase-like lactoylglutathione lyase family enzyme